MQKKKLKQTALLLVLTLLATTMATAQTVNMNKKITLTVRAGEVVRLRLLAAAANTGVRVISGSTYEFTVGTGWTGFLDYTAGAGTMTVYGDITGFDCDQNGADITAIDVTKNTALTELICSYNRLTTLDVTKNTALTELYCYGNQLTTLDVSKNTALTGLYCQNNRLTTLDISKNIALTALACSGNQLTTLNVTQNPALKKLWCYKNNFTAEAFSALMCSLPARAASDEGVFFPLENKDDGNGAVFMASNSQIAKDKNWRVCYRGSGNDIPATTGTYTCPNMRSAIHLTVEPGQQIKFGVATAASNTGVKIVNGSSEQIITTSPTPIPVTLVAETQYISIYGDINEFDCSSNSEKLKGISVGTCTTLEGLNCSANRIRELNLSNNTALKRLNCSFNIMGSSSLDLTQNTALTHLNCSYNQLSWLDLRTNTALKEIRCEGNHFSTLGLNTLMCSLPTLPYLSSGSFYPLMDNSSVGYAEFMASDSQIAKNKNWRVRYSASGNDIPATNGSYTCPGVNMNQYITLTVRQGEQIGLRIRGVSILTEIKVVSGSNSTQFSSRQVTDRMSYTAGAGTMTIYGDVEVLDCGGNGAKITAIDVSRNSALKTLICPNNSLTSLDVSRNTALTHLECHRNPLTTQAFNDLMCSMPTRALGDGTLFYPIWDAVEGNAAAFIAANSRIAMDKKWRIRYRASQTDIPATDGTYTCIDADMSKKITLAVQQGQQIKLRFRAAAEGTGVRIESGTFSSQFPVGTTWTTFQNYTAEADSMTFYGDIIGFDCGDNNAKVTAIDITRNTVLRELHCHGNSITALYTGLNTALTTLNCRDNRLTSLEVGRNTALTALWCSGNNFSTEALNDLMCSLPARADTDGATFFPLFDASDANASAFAATNSQVAKDKGWQVRYYNGTEIPATTGTFSCPDVDMSKYITLTVRQGEQINLGLKAAAAGTGVKIVSGTTSVIATVGTSWISGNYTADATTMTIYGNITGFGCSGNRNKITTIDASQSTSLANFYCYGNNFTTQVFNDIMCAMPPYDPTAGNGLFCPLSDQDDANHAAFMAANSKIAKYKDWDVNYYQGQGANDEIPPTNGTYSCPDVDMSKYITLTVRQGEQIWLEFKAAAAGTGVKVVSGSTNESVTVGTEWTNFRSYTAGAGTMTIYGDITGFDCHGNSITALDASKNPTLTNLTCYNNQLITLDVRQNTALTVLSCGSNQLISLDLRRNTALKTLLCQNNLLTSLDVSQNTALRTLQCYGNNFTTQAFNDLMCSLPVRAADDNAMFFPLLKTSSIAIDVFMEANSRIAKDKNWKVQYPPLMGGLAGEDIPVTNGTYTCPVVADMSKYITLTVTQGQQIQLDLKAATDDTPVKIVSGSNEQTITAGTNWTNFQDYTAGATTMTIYGYITGFDCSGNGAKLTALDASQNTALKELLCHSNRFTTQAFNDIMCSLPVRTTADNAKFYPLWFASSTSNAAFMAANAQIATAKNWKVRYQEGGDIPATTGTYVCGTGIADVAAAAPLTLYPNPVADLLHIETETTGAAITLTDLTGRTVLTATATDTTTTLHISHLSEGTYMVRVGDKVGKVVKK